MISQALLKMIEQIPDPKLKEHLVNVANEKIKSIISCLSPTCNGRVIGYIYNDGIPEADELHNKKGDLISGLLAVRMRFDGQYGFQCACLNDSRVAQAEEGVLAETPRPPTIDELNKIHTNLENKPTKVSIKNGTIEVDGFIIESI